MALYGGYSLAEILAHPFKEDATEDGLNMDEIEAESGGTHVPTPDEWEWDDET